jgi:hypothetical protein
MLVATNVCEAFFDNCSIYYDMSEMHSSFEARRYTMLNIAADLVL